MRIKNFISTIVLLTLSLSLALKEARAHQPASVLSKTDSDGLVVTGLTVTVFASSDRVRFTAPPSVVQIRLEVYNSTGKKVFDNEVRGGNVLDWHLEDGQADPIADDTYLCAVTVKSLSGRLAQKIGSVTLEKGRASVRAIDVSQLTAQQTEAIGPVEENSSLSVLKEDEPQTATVIAHNGEEGQLIRGQGAMSFRIGDFFRGKDREQMRLTAEGNLGIGITHPQARLDVDGLIRTNQGIVFPDGSIQFSAARRTFGAASFDPSVSGALRIAGQGEKWAVGPTSSGTGTTGRIVKWQDGPNGVLSDSVITELNGSIGINGPPNPIYKLDVNGHNRFRGSNVSFYLTGLKAGGNEWLFQTVDADGRLRIFDNTSGAERLSVSQSGNVGIGTANPARPLEIANGKLRFSSNLGDIEFTEVADLIAHATEANPVSDEPAFRVDTGTSLTPVFTVMNNGRVGIGNSNPAYKLHVIGGAAVGVAGFSSSNSGVLGSSNSAAGVFGSSGSGAGVYGLSASGLAGRFSGDVEVTGTLSKGSGSFKIDHPLDPENKYLYHSFVESPDMMNIYNGIVTLDEQGQAVVSLPEWFGALNRDFRYQLTCVGGFAPVYVAEKIKYNQFKIAGGQARLEVSWQVTGIRQDAYANNHRIKVEEDKTEKERGYYLYPEVFNQQEERGVEWARDPEMMRRLKETRSKQMEELKNSPKQ